MTLRKAGTNHPAEFCHYITALKAGLFQEYITQSAALSGHHLKGEVKQLLIPNIHRDIIKFLLQREGAFYHSQCHSQVAAHTASWVISSLR